MKEAVMYIPETDELYTTKYAGKYIIIPFWNIKGKLEYCKYVWVYIGEL